MRLFPTLALCAGAISAQVSFRPDRVESLPSFRRGELTRRNFSEGVAVGDLDRDGDQDLVSGPFWWEGPRFSRRHEIYAPRPFPIGTSSDQFGVWVHDVDSDGWQDVVSVSTPGRPAYWFRNPKRVGPRWARFRIASVVDLATPAYRDLDRDGAPELVCALDGRLGYYSPDPRDATRPWVFHAISPKMAWGPLIHGLGCGDIDGDGRCDVLTALGWWRQPPSLANDPLWTAFPWPFGAGGAQIHVYDVDGDSDNDVITSIAGHGYGLSWFEQRRSGRQIVFREHTILSRLPRVGRVQFSQLHGVALADVDADGLLDIVTGKTFWAGLGTDPEARAPAVVYAFCLRRSSSGVTFAPAQIDRDSGIGRQLVVRDLDGDRKVDIVTASKKGASVFWGR